MMDELPEGWAEAKLNDLLQFAIGGDWGFDSQSNSNSLVRVKVIRGTDFRNWQRDKGTSAAVRKIKPPSLQKRRLERGDLVLEVSGGGPDQPVGRTVLIDQEALNRATAPLVCSNFFRRLRLVSEVDPLFISRFLEWAYQRGSFNQFQTQTTNLRNLNVTNLLEGMEVLIAPLPEQRRIAEKLGTLLAEVEQCKERMAKIPVLLKRFRQSVLAAACSGRLTADWRENYREEGEDFGSSEDLPLGWKAVAVGDVICDLRYGTSSKCSLQPNGTAVLRIPNIGNGIIDNSELKYARLPEKELEKLALVPGDILMIRSNGSVSLVGKTAVVGDHERGFAYAGYLIRLRVKPDAILPLFLHFCFASSDMRQQIEIPARSTSGVNNINSEEVRQLSLLLPPIEEQEEIIRRAAKYLALADRIEERYQRAKKQVDGLTQAILAKAFRGELVPTEAELAAREGRSYETGEQLLQRIRQSELLTDQPSKTLRVMKKQRGR